MQEASGRGDLWTTKYAPRIYADVIGNKPVLSSLVTWLRNWNTDCPRGALLSGPPGIGKTTCAHLVAKKEKYQVLELNASDVRSKKLLNKFVQESTGSHTMTKYVDEPSSERIVIVMDEVDGMSGGDRGGLAELVLLLKQSLVPVICICNDRNNAKIKNLARYCVDLRFQRPTAIAIQGRIQAIAKKEGIVFPSSKSNVIQELVQSTGSDIRQILNVLNTYRQTSNAGSTSSKDKAPQSIFTATEHLFTSWRKESFSEKMQHYTNDTGAMPLMVHESYLKTVPEIANKLGGGDKKKTELKALKCLADAADSISLGDTILQGGNWSLMPVHGVLSTVRPCFYVQGRLKESVKFPSWFGKNSTSTKMHRLLREVQDDLCTKTSGTKRDLVLSYLPVLTPALVKPLIDEGKSGVTKVLSLMDDYSLTREDWESVQELELGAMAAKKRKVAPATKGAFTRAYNKSNPPSKMKRKQEFEEGDEEEEGGSSDLSNHINM